jgi:hypothetical protein
LLSIFHSIGNNLFNFFILNFVISDLNFSIAGVVISITLFSHHFSNLPVHLNAITIANPNIASSSDNIFSPNITFHKLQRVYTAQVSTHIPTDFFAI